MSERTLDLVLQILDLTRSPGDHRVLIVGSRRRAREVAELRTRVLHRFENAVVEFGDVVVRRSRGAVRFRFVVWPKDEVRARRFDVVALDVELPALVQSSAADPRRTTVLW